MENGTVVTRSDIIADDITGASFAVVDCPSEKYVESLVAQKHFFQQSNAATDRAGIRGAIGTVFHLAPAEVLLSPSYGGFLSGFPATTLHVILNVVHSPAVDAMMAGQRNIILLNQLHSNIFPAPRPSGVVPEVNTSQAIGTDHNFLHDQLRLPRETCVCAQTKARVQLIPITPTTTLDLQEVPEALDQKQIIAEAYDTNLLSRECIASLRKIEAVSKHGTCFRLSLSNSGLILDPLH